VTVGSHISHKGPRLKVIPLLDQSSHSRTSRSRRITILLDWCKMSKHQRFSQPPADRS